MLRRRARRPGPRRQHVRLTGVDQTREKTPPAAAEVSRLADHLFRHEAGKLVSVLTGVFGIERLQLAEDVVQEALIRALKTWPYHGIPRNPAAWIMQTAKNLALDAVRRETRFRHKQPEIVATIEQWGGESGSAEPARFETEIKDARLRLMFACCHPEVPREAQAALALKTLCGFSVPEIARAFLTTEAAVAKRLTRARQAIRDRGIRFEIPEGGELADRLEGVLQTLYLLFNEGYKASVGEALLREELCAEALRLALALAEHPAGNQPAVHALLALMCLNTARFNQRLDAEGNILLLRDQDRSRWDPRMIARGLLHLEQSAAGGELSRYHLEAGIAACHCTATEYTSTDWPRILSLYDALAKIDSSPVVAVNRAVALAYVEGPAAGIAALEVLRSNRSLQLYPLFYAVLAELELQQGHFASAVDHLKSALDLTTTPAECTLLSSRLRHCEDHLQDR
jgi:RNA polymerase sigma factor (sigma-70 family)